MKQDNLNITATDLRGLLETGKDIFVLDVRPLNERSEWQIPGSVHLDAYQRLNDNDLTVMEGIDIPLNKKVITVCAAGRTSMMAAQELRNKGIEAYSLAGGMKAWSLAWNTARLEYPELGFEILQVRRTGKGCLSYILYSKGCAVIIDPSLNVEVYEQLLEDHDLKLKYVIETHTHADHLSRAHLLAEKFNAELLLPGHSKVAFDHRSVYDNDTITLQSLSIRAIYTPGHTYDSMSYLANDRLLFTGDTLFTDSIGRPDLKSSPEETKMKTSALFHSLRRILSLPENLIVLPGHTNKPVEFDNVVLQTTIAQAKDQISILKLDEDEFITMVLIKLPPTPENYMAIVASNIFGEPILDTALESGANRCSLN
jgi:glyoxylase-like metal-dependent hydrolase (beta-lactamase superfamily II)/rhodanese-related sulfurtransferase